MLENKISRHLFLQKKHLFHRLMPKTEQKCILFIIGCQRSGTTLMSQTFENDLRTKLYHDFSKLSSHDAQERLRLNAFPLIEKEFCKQRPSFIILKPLVETQNILQLLQCHEGSSALWMYRNYRDVASSNLKRFGLKNGINNLRPIFNGQVENWRAENVSEEMTEIVRRNFSEEMNPYDAATLFWVVRNSFFFKLELGTNDKVLMCKYEDFIKSPVQYMAQIYCALGQSFPGESITRQTHTRSINKGHDIEISTEIEALAEELLSNLDQAYAIKNQELCARSPLF